MALTIAAIILGGAATPAGPRAQDPVIIRSASTSAETGQYVCAEFLTYFNSHGGLFCSVSAIVVSDTALGRKVQYFQRTRLEMHPENPEPYRVQQGLLGDELGFNNFPPAASEDIPTFNSTFHHYFPETGHVVSFDFLRFFREKGGLDVFGYPRSGEFMFEDGCVVQYFQRERNYTDSHILNHRWH